MRPINEERRWGGGPRQEIRIIIIDRSLISSLFPFVTPLPRRLDPPTPPLGAHFNRGKRARHKADRFSRLIHLVEVNKHCVPYLSPAQLMRERNPLALCRGTFFLPPLPRRFHPRASDIVAGIAACPGTPLVLSLTRHYLCR